MDKRQNNQAVAFEGEARGRMTNPEPIESEWMDRWGTDIYGLDSSPEQGKSGTAASPKGDEISSAWLDKWGDYVSAESSLPPSREVSPLSEAKVSRRQGSSSASNSSLDQIEKPKTGNNCKVIKWGELDTMWYQQSA